MTTTRARVMWVTTAVVAACCAVLAGAWFSRGVTGEVFLVDSNGRVQTAPGAVVRVFRSEGKSVVGFLYSPEQASRDAQFERERKERFDKHLAWIEAAGNDQERLDFLAKNFDFLEQSYDSVRCSKFASEAVRSFGTAVQFTRADQQGRFSIQLPPGNYVLWVTGQAGSRHGEWLEDTRVIWRTNIRLVEPACEYQELGR